MMPLPIRAAYDLEMRGAALAALAQILQTVPARPGPLLAVALEWLCAVAAADFGALLALEGEAVAAEAICDHGMPVSAVREQTELLLTQGIAGYAVARGAPILLRDISADPRWGPPSLSAIFPNAGAALALSVSEPAQVVLVLTAAHVNPFTAETAAWLAQALELLCGPLGAALALEKSG